MATKGAGICSTGKKQAMYGERQEGRHAMKSKKKAFEELMEEFSSMEILEAVSSLDEIRGIVEDREINRPPEIREKLMKLHEMVMDEKITSGGETIWDLANEIQDELFPLQEAIEHIMDVLEKITDSAPENDDE
ncbi:MAG: hypothetical protein RDU59_12920 [Thermodesulfobacteriota bacterium]|nr:hypothetical protein [Thermodesulfobacteriota bacterium]